MHWENLVIYNKMSQISKKHWNICYENISILKFSMKKDLKVSMFHFIDKLTKMWKYNLIYALVCTFVDISLGKYSLSHWYSHVQQFVG